MLGRKTGGRQKGTANKNTAAVKEMILAALEKAGGVEYLFQQSSTNPTAFMTLVGKVLPLTLDGTVEVLPTYDLSILGDETLAQLEQSLELARPVGGDQTGTITPEPARLH